MKIDKAIEILEDIMTSSPTFPPDDRRDAVKLGIEALKECLFQQQAGSVKNAKRLSGETEETKND